MQKNSNTLFGSSFGPDGQIVCVGAPIQLGTINGRGGCEHAPQVLRQYSSFHKLAEQDLYSCADSKVILRSNSLSDVGDILFSPTMHLEKYFNHFEEVLGFLYEMGKIPLILGGDHLVTYYALSSLKKQVKKFQFIHFDAHRDLGEISELELPTHSNFVSYVLSWLEVVTVLQVGIRGFSPFVKMSPKISTVGIPNEELLKKYLSPNIPCYISVDLDCLNPIYFDAVNFPVAHGLNDFHVYDTFEVLKKMKIKILGIDFCEFNPSIDKTGKNTAILLDLIARSIQSLAT
ncbi:MAG: arginase family protein [Bdellovibrionales bacterium]|nr:arginase family protein [Bdellovibrionales bacterium]